MTTTEKLSQNSNASDHTSLKHTFVNRKPISLIITEHGLAGRSGPRTGRIAQYFLPELELRLPLSDLRCENVPCVSLTSRPGHHWLSLSPTSALRSHARQPPPATRTRTLGLSSAPQLLQTDWRLTEVAIREFGGIRWMRGSAHKIRSSSIRFAARRNRSIDQWIDP